MVTVGFFDGVHLGHRAVLGRTVEVARERGLPSVAVTFDRHPREVPTPGQEPRPADHGRPQGRPHRRDRDRRLLVLEFTWNSAGSRRRRSSTRVLVEGLHAAHCAMGANFTFGHRAAGTVEMLIETGPKHGFRRACRPRRDRPPTCVVVLDPDALANGDLGMARGRPRPAVRHHGTDSAARDAAGLGYPTTNLRTGPRLLVRGRGICAGRALVEVTPARRRDQRGENPDVRR